MRRCAETRVSERYRDAYRRCLAVFFVTARIANPDSDLVLVVNRPWRPDASQVSCRNAVIARIGGRYGYIRDFVLVRAATIVAYRLAQPVLRLQRAEVIHAITDPHDLIMLLDSDVVWTALERTDAVWGRLGAAGSLTMELGIPSA